MHNHHILITGGSSGIGLAIAELCVAAGATVHLNARREELLERARVQLGEQVITYAGDIANREDRERLFTELARHCQGRLDGLILNAAKYAVRPLIEESDAALESIFRTNTLSAVDLVRRSLPLLLKGNGKSILFVSSSLSTRPVPNAGAYAASKAAMNSLAQSFALELASQKIRCNAILPGVVDTPIHEPQSATDLGRAEKLEMLGRMHPLGRVGQPEEVAQAALFLLSEKAAWVTGSLFYVDGGIHLA